MLRNLCLILSSLVCLCSIASSEVFITDHWKYTGVGSSTFADVALDDSGWECVDLPHTWNAGDVIDEQRGYRRAPSWYRKKLAIPAEAVGRNVMLRFDGVASTADIYVDGRLLKSHKGAFTAFEVDITDIAAAGGEHVLAVRVDNSASLGEVLPPVSGDFSVFGGIYRRVSLRWSDKIHFVTGRYAAQPVRVKTPEVSAEKASMHIETRLRNDNLTSTNISVGFFLKDAGGSVVKEKNIKLTLRPGEEKPVFADLKDIRRPHLWSPETPYLYTVETRVSDASTGREIESHVTTAGFRWFSVDKTGFYLNGRHVKLRGAARHQDYGGLGTAIPSALNRHDMQLLKDMGANFVRISHYPQDPEIYRACDELGLIAWSEICIVNEVKKNNDFVHNCKEMLKEMILQNFNHPSVVMWGAFNELWDYHPEAVALGHELEAIKKELDGDRLSCVAFHAFTWEKPYTQDSREMFEISDINGVNVYEGWYHGDSTTVAPLFDKFCTYSAGRPRFLSEFGAGSDSRIHTYKPARFDFSPEYQVEFNRWYIDEMERRPDFVGYSIWNLIDFQVDGRGDSRPNLNQKGMVTENRQKKDVYYYYQARWSDRPMLRIAGADWAERTEVCDDSVSAHEVCVFSNQDSVALSHNGKPLGTRRVVDGRAVFSVPFRAGSNVLLAGSGQFVDLLEINMTFVPSRLVDGPALRSGICINAGEDHCYFTDPVTREQWLPDQAYQPGGWGYVASSSASGKIFGKTGANIRNTVLDPLFQPYLNGVSGYRFDVPDGEYEVELYFTEPESNDIRRTFDISINGKTVASALNLAEDYGVQSAVMKSARVRAGNSQGINISFIPHEGDPVVSAVKVKKIK